MASFIAPSLPLRGPQRRRRSRPCMSAAAGRDAAAMRRCVELARRAAGQTRPNPPVGCVLHDAAGRLLGEGWHHRAGLPHAEPTALADAAARGNPVAGATVYVSLEPCNHFGRTPPCSHTLVEAGVARVVVGMVDPNPRVAGQGLETLRRGGVDVVVGVEEEACQELAEGFVSRIVKKRPFGILKYAMTLDGKIASESGSSKWVTGEDARRHVHKIRSYVDAIVVGGQTMRADDPRLTVRDSAADDASRLLSPLRVVMSESMQLPREARMWQTADLYETVVLTRTGHGEDAFAKELRHKGVIVEEVPGLRPDDAMAFLFEKGCLNVLWECGGGLAASAIKDGSVQKIHAFIAPKMVGGQASPSPVGSPPLALEMEQALELKRRKLETFSNGDILISGYLE